MKLFFGASKPKATPKDAIITLRENLSMLEKRESHLQTKIDLELKRARENATRNKKAALAALKRKKLLEAQIEKISGSRMTLEAQVMTIEAANVNLETMRAMQKGAEAMKGIHRDLDVDKVDETMDEIREQMDLANEVSEAISQPQMFGMELDEDELNAELEELEQEELDKRLLDAEHVALPRPPVAIKQQSSSAPVEEDEDDELAELRESMGMAA
ncbi:ESCRT-III subunit protein snf7 [Coemansia spiralis]|uniref:Vacuolar-sorting protein SNF7 n=2 Tax=Coemansia TaxID=4863 RepID=A0A9W8G5C2_9FUNG|nr:Snf7-domain-containing protein [Coemansia spiralis]KAJ1993920.1 ESCRT-III subunit protein snf7 [Coemansia umbellata]KAJ2622685.1 ESCRT-III subunit protein snf7 [Coemansia sp. RSA 1358]KAJ2679102.1 ESCRT-III subunit protein snf7 [Coemansia spiralis]